MRSARARLALIVAATLALLGLLIADLASDPGGRGADAAATGGLEGAVRPPDAPPARFALRDQDGTTVTAAALRRQVTIVTFVYSTCQDTCPLTVQQIRGALDRIGHPVPVVAVSVDPAADTVFHVRRFLAAQSMLGRMRYLIGTRAQLAPVWRAFGIAPERKDSPHSVSTVLLDSRGHQRVGFGPDDLTPEALAHDVGVLEGAS